MKSSEIKIGDKFGKLTVIELPERRNKEHKLLAVCRCECGNIIEVVKYKLVQKNKPVQSCGCLRIERLHEIKTVHGQAGGLIVGSRTQLYRCWSNIKSRCYNSKVRSYADYGAKGIKMCDEWLQDFVAFSKWATSNGFKEGLTINRIDPTKDYCPENCEWITLSENSRLAKKEVHCWGRELLTNEYYEFDNIRQFAREHDLSYSAIDQVLHKHNKTHKGWIFGYL